MTIAANRTTGTTRTEEEGLAKRVLSLLFDPALVAVVRSSSAAEADIDDTDLMRYYVDHPETDRDSLLAEFDE